MMLAAFLLAVVALGQLPASPGGPDLLSAPAEYVLWLAGSRGDTRMFVAVLLLGLGSCVRWAFEHPAAIGAFVGPKFPKLWAWVVSHAWLWRRLLPFVLGLGFGYVSGTFAGKALGESLAMGFQAGMNAAAVYVFGVEGWRKFKESKASPAAASSAASSGT